MIVDDSVQPIQSYAKTLLSGLWVEWSENALCSVPNTEFHSAGGFQELIEAKTSHPRSRAGEAYRIGLLLKPVVSSGRGTGRDAPSGWNAVCRGEPVHSRLGYIAYAIGKAFSKGEDSRELEDSLSVLNLIFSLASGIEEDGHVFSTLLVYEHTLRSFENNVGSTDYADNEVGFMRWVAAALFDTLNETTARSSVLECYKENRPIIDLVFRDKDKATGNVTETPITPIELLEHFQGTRPIGCNANKDHKDALYWASPGESFYDGVRRCRSLFHGRLLTLDQASFQSSGTGILEDLLRVRPGDNHQLLEGLTALSKTDPILTDEWNKLMDMLKKGVYEALKYIDASSAASTPPSAFYVHGLALDAPFEDRLEVDVPTKNVPIEPKAGTFVFIGNQKFALENIQKKDEETLTLTLAITSSIAEAGIQGSVVTPVP